MPGLKLPFGRKKQKSEPAGQAKPGALKPEAQRTPADAPEAPAMSPSLGALATPEAAHAPPDTGSKPPERPADSGLGELGDVFAKETDERDEFHKTIAVELEPVSARTLLLESQDVARSMRRMRRSRR